MNNQANNFQEQLNEFVSFTNDKVGDTPTNALQLVPKKYADTGGPMDTMTYAATITLNPALGRFHTTTTINATGNATINASSGGLAGQTLNILITNDGTSGKTITFGTNFKPSATLVGTASKSAMVNFVSNGTSFYESSRQTGL